MRNYIFIIFLLLFGISFAQNYLKDRADIIKRGHIADGANDSTKIAQQAINPAYHFSINNADSGDIVRFDGTSWSYEAISSLNSSQFDAATLATVQSGKQFSDTASMKAYSIDSLGTIFSYIGSEIDPGLFILQSSGTNDGINIFTNGSNKLVRITEATETLNYVKLSQQNFNNFNNYFYKGDNLKYWYAKLIHAVRGGGTSYPYVNSLHIGDSKGAYSTEYAQETWKQIGYGGLGWISFGNNKFASYGYADVTLTGGWTTTLQGATDVLWGLDGSSLTATGSDSITVEFTKDWQYARIWYDGAAGTSFVLSVNGLPADTITTNSSGFSATRIDVGSVGTHTLSIGSVSGAVVIYGADVWGSKIGYGIITQVVFKGGSKASEWKDHMEAVHVFMDSISPGVVMIDLGSNDASSSVTASTYKTYINTIIDSIQAADTEVPIVLFLDSKQSIGATNTLLGTYRTPLIELIGEEGVSFYDVYSFLVNNSTAQNLGIGSVDGVHPSTQGYELIAFNLLSVMFNGNFQAYASLRESNTFPMTQYFSRGIFAADTPSGFKPITVQSGGVDQWYVDRTGFQYIAEGIRLYFLNSTGNYQFRVNSNQLQLIAGSDYAFSADVNNNFGIGTNNISSSSTQGGLFFKNFNNPPSTIPADHSLLYDIDAAGAGTTSLKILNENNTGFIIHDLGVSSPAILDTTWSSYDGMLRLWIPSLNDSVSVPFKY